MPVRALHSDVIPAGGVVAQAYYAAVDNDELLGVGDDGIHRSAPVQDGGEWVELTVLHPERDSRTVAPL